MKKLFLLLFFPMFLHAQPGGITYHDSTYLGQRDSVYTIDSTMTDGIVFKFTLNKKDHASFVRAFGEDWQNVVERTIRDMASKRDTYDRESFDKVQALNLTNPQKKIVLDGFGYTDPRTVRLVRSVKVPAWITVQVPDLP